MIWYDCKKNPPKRNIGYIGYFERGYWEQVWYYPKKDLWKDFMGDVVFPIKWAEIDLPKED